MKTWLTPTAVEDKFIPNEAVSTCYAVACDWSEANKYEDRFGLKGTDSFINDKGEWVVRYYILVADVEKLKIKFLL